MIRPPELNTSREGFGYTPPVHFAVREGHAEGVQVLLGAGAYSEWNVYYGDTLIGMARERGFDNVVRMLEQNRSERGRMPPATARDYPIQINFIREIRRFRSGFRIRAGTRVKFT